MTDLMITGIMACTQRGVIGEDGKLPWDLPKELEHFQNTVRSGIMIMGRKTFESTGEKILSECFNFVLSKDKRQNTANVTFASSLEELLDLLPRHPNRKIFMIGGAKVAELFLRHNLVSDFLLTKIHKEYKGNEFFPLHLLENWRKVVAKSGDDFTVFRYFRE